MATDSERLQNDADEFFTSYDEVFDSFDAMGLHENLLRGIYAHGLEKPSAIQQSGVVPFCKGLDVVQHAPTGSGNTATFCLGILHQLDYSLVQCQALILTSTKELAQKTEKLMQALGYYLNVTIYCCNSDRAGEWEYHRTLRDGVHVVVGTPGRVFDMFRRKYIPANIVRMLVLYGADEMLSLGFKDLIHDIFKRLPPKIQVGVFSATMPPEALEISRELMKSSVRILVKVDEPEPTLEGIKQFYVNVEKEEWKLDTLLDLYMTIALTKSMVVVNTRSRVEWLIDRMQDQHHTVSAVHGDMDPNQRKTTLRDFNFGVFEVLIINDDFLLASGIDAQQVSLVLNYDLPPNPENYIQRVARRGVGVAISFVTSEDEKLFSDIQSFYNVVIEELPTNLADLI